MTYYLASLAHERALTEAEERAEAGLQGELPCPICSSRQLLFREGERDGIVLHILKAHPESEDGKALRQQLESWGVRT